jgi:tripartite-type tricarboxylate transporter receptor subunit TctC
MRTGLWASALVALIGTPLSQTRAEDYPTKPITMIVPYPPGGGVDLIGRLVAERLTAALGQQVIVENRGGAGGMIGTRDLAKAAPDGYTVGVGTSGISLSSSAGYDVNKDFSPIGLIASTPIFIVAHPSFPAKSLAELIALARQQPGKLNYGNSGYGAAAHLSAELFKTEAHVEIVGINYKGAAPALQDLIAGQTQLMFATSASVVGHIKSGLVRPIAVTTLKRFSLMPDLPTVAESGLPGFDATTWHGLVAPAHTPKDVIAALHRATVEGLEDPETRARLADLGVEIAATSPAEFAAYIKSEIPKWTAVVKAAGVKLE